MNEPILLTEEDSRLAKLNFKPYRNINERRTMQYLPNPDEPQSIEIATPWGATLTAKAGDYLVSDLDAPEDRWPVEREIFESTYLEVRPGYCIKRVVTELIPLADITGGDEDQIVKVRSREGDETVRAGDFFLARGAKGEIWVVPSAKVYQTMVLAEGD